MSDKIVLSNDFSTRNRALVLGKQGEHAARRIVFDFSSWRETFGEGTLTLFIKRHDDATAYPVVPNIDGNTAIWSISATDTAMYGSGSAELRYAVDGAVVKSEKFSTFVHRSIASPDAPPPDPYDSWIEMLVTLGDNVREEADRAERAAVHSPRIRDSDKHWLVWDTVRGEYVDTGVTAGGEPSSGGISDTDKATEDEIKSMLDEVFPPNQSAK